MEALNSCDLLPQGDNGGLVDFDLVSLRSNLQLLLLRVLGHLLTLQLATKARHLFVQTRPETNDAQRITTTKRTAFEGDSNVFDRDSEEHAGFILVLKKMTVCRVSSRSLQHSSRTQISAGRSVCSKEGDYSCSPGPGLRNG